MEEEVRFECAQPNEKDCKVVFEWRNDPVTRQMSRDTRPKVWEQFLNEYNTRMFSCAELPPLFILKDGRRVGFIFFEPDEHLTQKQQHTCCVSINIAPDKRGQGIGKEALKKISAWVKRQGYDAINAYVREDNQASLKAFETIGYKKIKTKTEKSPDGKEMRLSVLVLQLTPPTQHESVFIIAEAGSNWHVGTSEKQNRRQAIDLIDAAAEAGANAIKFQVFRPHTTYVRNAGEPSYLQKGTTNIWKLFEQLAMPYDMIPELANYCRECNIEFMASAFSLEDFAAVAPFTNRVKIASYEITHPHLITAAAQSGKTTYMSTGCANSFEIDWAVNLFRSRGGQKLVLMQCSGQYPAEPESMNLRAINWLRKRFNVEVGLSDHSLDPIAAPTAAVALGAKAIEKHFTLDRALPGPDHVFAILPFELKALVQTVRTIESMLGTSTKTVQPGEMELRHFAQRRVQAIKNIAPGELLNEGVNVAILRPGKQIPGMHPMHITEMEGKFARRQIPEGQGIHKEDFT